MAHNSKQYFLFGLHGSVRYFFVPFVHEYVSLVCKMNANESLHQGDIPCRLNEVQCSATKVDFIHHYCSKAD